MEEINIKNIIIGKQFQTCENYEKFVQIVKKKKINVSIVSSGNRVNIEKNIYLDVLWPDTNKKIMENILNNNSLVCKLNYKKNSILFTGDIEAVAEKEILKKYQSKSNILKSNIIKIAHHGSKSSSIEEFLNEVKPNIALIGVGKNNNFGHPSQKTLENLRKFNCKYYRTDECGEIALRINEKKIMINRRIKTKIKE